MVGTALTRAAEYKVRNLTCFSNEMIYASDVPNLTRVLLLLLLLLLLLSQRTSPIP